MAQEAEAYTGENILCQDLVFKNTTFQESSCLDQLDIPYRTFTWSNLQIPNSNYLFILSNNSFASVEYFNTRKKNQPFLIRNHPTT